MTKHFEELERTPPERRALFQMVEREVDAFLAWEHASMLPAQVAGIAVLSLHELGVVAEGRVVDWSTLRYDLVLERFPRVSLVHPWVAGSYLDVWVTWAHWLHAQRRIGAPDRDRLLDEIVRGADRFMGDVAARFALLAPGLLNGERPRLPS